MKVRNQITETRTKIRAEAQHVIRSAENDYKAAAAQEASVFSALESAKQEALDLGRRAVTYDSRKQEVDAARTVLDNLMSRSKETDVASELKSTNIRIVDPAAVPEDPIRPKKLRDILLGFILGAFLSLGAAFFLEYLDNTLKTPDDIRNHLGVPLLGVIPEQAAAKEPSALLVNREHRGPLRRGLPRRPHRPRLLLARPRPAHPDRHLHLTRRGQDPHRGEPGGHPRRLRPQDAAHRRRHAPAADATPSSEARRSPGLSDALVGKAKPSEVIQQSRGRRLLRLPALGHHGPEPRRPPHLAHHGGPRWTACEKFYDWIVIDTPPVGAVAEPLILAPLARRRHRRRRRRDGPPQGGRPHPRAHRRHRRPRPRHRPQPSPDREALVLLQPLLRALLRALLRPARDRRATPGEGKRAPAGAKVAKIADKRARA